MRFEFKEDQMRPEQGITVSIVVPIYNVEQYLEQCIDSILKQSYSNLQVILVDDGSPDNCGRIIDGYASKDNRVFCIHKKNGGLSSARNAGIKVAKGECICFIDSDDFIDRRFIEMLLKDLLDNDADISACYFDSFIKESVTVNAPTSYHLRCFSREEVICEMYKNDSIGWNAWNKLYKTSLFDDTEYPDGIICEDKATTYKLFLKSTKIVYRNVPLYHYRIRENSISGRRSVQYYSDSLSINSLMEKDLEKSKIEGAVELARAYSAKSGLLIYEATHSKKGYKEIAVRALDDLRDNYRYVWNAGFLNFTQKLGVWLCGYSVACGRGFLLRLLCAAVSIINLVRNAKLK